MQRDPSTGRRPDPTLHLWVGATPRDVRNGLHAVRAHLAALSVPEDTLDLTELIAAEIFNNVVEHALVNMSDTGFSAVVTKKFDDIILEVEDEGKPMPNKTLPVTDLPAVDVPVEDLPEGGFGWALVRTLTRDLAYARRDGRNCLVARIAVAAPA